MYLDAIEVRALIDNIPYWSLYEDNYKVLEGKDTPLSKEVKNEELLNLTYKLAKFSEMDMKTQTNPLKNLEINR